MTSTEQSWCPSCSENNSYCCYRCVLVRGGLKLLSIEEKNVTEKSLRHQYEEHHFFTPLSTDLKPVGFERKGLPDAKVEKTFFILPSSKKIIGIDKKLLGNYRYSKR